MKMHFAAPDVRTLLAHSEAAAERAPTMEQLFEGKLRHDGKDIDPAGLKPEDWPVQADVDPAKVPAGLWLVGDQGVYFLSNGRPRLPPSPGASGNAVARSEETDSARNPDSWYDAKVAAFGDDGVVFLAAAFVRAMLERGDDARCCLTLTPNAVAPATPAPAKARAAARMMPAGTKEA